MRQSEKCCVNDHRMVLLLQILPETNTCSFPPTCIEIYLVVQDKEQKLLGGDYTTELHVY